MQSKYTAEMSCKKKLEVVLSERFGLKKTVELFTPYSQVPKQQRNQTSSRPHCFLAWLLP